MEIDITDPRYSLKMKIVEALYEVNDPELGINIVDLGLVYDVSIDEEAKQVSIEMTLSTRSCPMGGMLTAHAKVAVSTAVPEYETAVHLVWEPKWDASRISAAGKEMLGW